MYLDDVSQEDARRRNEERAAELKERPGSHEIDAGTWGALLAMQFNTLRTFGRDVQDGTELVDESTLSLRGREMRFKFAEAAELVDLDKLEVMVLTGYILHEIDEFLAAVPRWSVPIIRTPEMLYALLERVQAQLARLTVMTDGTSYVYGYPKGRDQVPRRILIIEERFVQQCEQELSGRSG